jgi:hypothetical protein
MKMLRRARKPEGLHAVVTGRVMPRQCPLKRALIDDVCFARPSASLKKCDGRARVVEE